MSQVLLHVKNIPLHWQASPFAQTNCPQEFHLLVNQLTPKKMAYL